MLPGRIELPTSALPRMRSTTELRQHDHSNHSGGAEFRGSGRCRGRGALLCAGAGNVKAQAMDESPKGQSREERLAASLRENLKRRKAQARALASESRATSDTSADARAPTLPKADTKS